jgi:putative ABC transport system permease protein
MWENYFKTAFRNLAKNKFYTFINVICLGLAITSFIFIYKYVNFERSFDKFHTNGNNIYRVISRWNVGKQNEETKAMTVAWSGPGAKETIPEISEFARVAPIKKFIGKKLIRYNDVKISESKIFLADSGFFKIFSFKLLRGDIATVFREPFSIVLKASVAKKYFTSFDDIFGKVVEIETEGHFSQNAFKVTGIVEDPPVNSHLQFSALISFNSMIPSLFQGAWYLSADYTYNYVLLNLVLTR